MDKQLKTYFENVIDLEKNAYTQRETLSALDSKISSLGRGAYIQRSEVRQEADWMVNILSVGFFCVPGGAIILGIKGLLSNFISGALDGILKGALIGLGITLIISFIKYAIDRGKEKETQAQYDASYNQKMAADNRRITEENKQKSHLVELRTELLQQHQNTQNALQEYYGVGLIYPKYHNINAMCSFYEYYMSGRCSQLTGHEGAYNIYENELRANLILTKLDDILANLEQIKGNQYMLYSALSEGNKKIDNLIAESERQTRLANFTAEQSAIAAYNAAEARSELNQLKWLKTYELVKKRY